ncbi:nSTAND1 domain-containing NTPase [Streptomyces luteogriseus]|uniref:nSTAND1 domain-containing NTPase n=1 Tax=Streptomyces luteogriseus TaxID=68233 RepID=UPI0037A9A5AD
MTSTDSAPRSGVASDLPTAVARILGPDGRVAGTGFRVAEGVLVTCAHVVEAAGGGPGSTVRLSVPHVVGADQLEGTVPDEWWRSVDDEDVAFIRLSDPPDGVRILPLGAAEGCRGHNVRSFGFPAQAPPEGHFGFGVTGDLLPAAHGRGAHLQLTDANDLTTGFSGGPVLDEVTGLVIGMLTEITAPDAYERGLGIAYATPTRVLREILPELAEREVCPYRGLEPFTAEHARWFQGRSEAVRQVLANLAQRRRLTLLLGPSGSGKSSLIQAGVLRALAAGELPGSDQWLPVLARPRQDILAAIERAGLPGASQDGIITAVNRRLAAEPSCERVVLVIDQFEELLVQSTNGRLRDLLAVVDEVTSAADAYTKITVILIMRDDFYPQLAALAPKLLEAAMPGLLNVPGTLSQQDLHDIVVLPALDVGLRFQPGLPERIITDVLEITPEAAVAREAPVTVLPLLEMTLSQLWHRRQDGYLTHEAYRRIGGVSGSVTTWCDSALDELSSEQQVIARRALTSLVHPADPRHNIYAVRTQVPLNELRDLAADPGDTGEQAAVDSVIAALTRRRIITTQTLQASQRPGALPGEPVAELIHEALIRDWGALRQWVDQDHRFHEWLDLTRERQVRWAAQKDPGDLLGGTALAEGVEWSHQRRLPADIGEFLTASKVRQRAAIRRSRRLNAVLGGLLVLALVAAGGAIWQWQTVATEREAAMSRQLAAQSLELTGANPELAALLAVKAYRTSHTSEAMESLRYAGALPVHRRLSGHTNEVRAVAYSPDRRTFASAGADRTVRLWDTATNKVRTTLEGHSDAVNAVAFSPDRRTLATASADKTVRLWDLNTGKTRTTLKGHTDQVRSVAFAPDGDTIATGGADSLTRLWDADTGEARGTLEGHTQAVTSVAFHPEGHTIATGGADNTVRLWDPVTGEARSTLKEHDQPVTSVVFSPDGRTLATAGRDKTVRLWDAGPADDRTTFPGHDGEVWGAAFSPDGRTFATAGADKTVRLWNTATGKTRTTLKGHENEVNAVAFSPDGRTVATVSDDSTTRLWNTETGKTLRTLKGHDGEVWGAAFSPDGRTLATAGADATTHLWNTATGKTRTTLKGHENEVNAVAFSPDGRTVATVSDDSTTRLWNTETGKTRITLSGHNAAVRAVAFSPDGRTLATGSSDATVLLWDAATGESRITLTEHTAEVNGVAFSPDGHTLATTGADGTVRVWEAATGKTRTTLNGNTVMNALALSPDGRTLITAGADGIARQWDVATSPEPAQAIEQICRIFGRDLTTAERAAYLPDDSEASVCSER